MENYARDLDLNLLRVFSVVAETGSVTQAAARLYLTQPAVSAALARLSRALGATLFVRQGRRLVLTSRGQRLRARAQLHLQALIEAALAPAEFDPLSTERVMRVGVSDASELWLLPALFKLLEREAPHLRLIAIPVQFRSVARAFEAGEIELAVTVADELPSSIRRKSLFHGDFVCLLDPRHVRAGKRMSESRYFASRHLIVSYNRDLRGIVEDALNRQRDVRCSVASFGNLGALIEHSSLVATVPRLVARQTLLAHPRLRMLELPFALHGAAVELLWPQASDDDAGCRFMCDCIERIARELATTSRSRAAGKA